MPIPRPTVEAGSAQVVHATVDHRATHYVMHATLSSPPWATAPLWIVALESTFYRQRGTWGVLTGGAEYDWAKLMDWFDLNHEGDREGYTALLDLIGVTVLP